MLSMTNHCADASTSIRLRKLSACLRRKYRRIGWQSVWLAWPPAGTLAKDFEPEITRGDKLGTEASKRPNTGMAGAECRRHCEASMTRVSITRVGGPTALLEIDGFRLLTDPTFDAPGEYRLPHVTLRKTTGPGFELGRDRAD